MGEVLVRAGLRTISVGVAALALGFAFKSGGTYAAASADVGPTISVFGTIHPDIFRLRTPIGAQIPDAPGVRLASLDTDVASWAAVEEETGSVAAPESAAASFDERFGAFETRIASFDERFDSAAGEPRNRVLRRPDPVVNQAALPATAQPGPRLASLPPRAATLASLPQPRPASAPKNHFRPAEGRKDPAEGPAQAARDPSESKQAPGATPDADTTHTAIYDITAKTVYLPDGRRLEAHSGLGPHMDDPRSVSLRMHGPTPPNVYNLSLRESLFHGVRALRLTPAGNGKMYGRDGILAHSYMLGPNGQSNGCVSFGDYPAFLNAYLKGEVNRLVVVEHLDAVPASKTQFASASWLPDAVKKFFKPAEYAAAQ